MNAPGTYHRIASLDFQRGLAIWLMVILHAMEHAYDYKSVTDEPVSAITVSSTVVVLSVIVGYFASWNSYFLLISSTVNTLSMTRNAARGIKPWRILSKQLLLGASVLLIGIFVNGFLYDGYLGTAIRTGDWLNVRPMTNGVFAMYTLQIIGWSMMIGGITQYLLSLGGGYRKTKRNILIYLFLALLVVGVSPLVHRWVDGMSWEIPSTLPSEYTIGDHSKWPSVHVQSANASFGVWFFAFLAGDLEPVFPYLATWFVGGAIGLALLEEPNRKRLLSVGGLAVVGTVLLGILFTARWSFTVGNVRPGTGKYLLMLGGQVGAVLLFLWLVEFRGNPEVFANRRAVRALRLWGMASLTIWSLEIFELLPRSLFGCVYNAISPQKLDVLRHGFLGAGQEPMALLIAIFVMLSFHAMVVIWSKFDFKCMLEWFVIRIASVGSGTISRRLDVDYMMNQMQWASFGANTLQASQAKSSGNRWLM
jgi:hypothetical protein